MQVGCVALVLVCATDSIKGMLQFSSGARHYAAAFVSPLLQLFTFVSALSDEPVLCKILNRYDL